MLEVRKYKKTEYFKTDLQQVFGFLQRETDKKALAEYIEQHKTVFTNICEDAYDVISIMSKTRQPCTDGFPVELHPSVLKLLADIGKYFAMRIEE